MQRKYWTKWVFGLAIVVTSGSTLEAQDQFQIQLRSRSFTPGTQLDVQAATAEIFASDDVETKHVILQFQKRLTAEDHARLRKANVVLHTPLGGHAYLATVPNLRARPQTLAATTPFRAIASLTVNDKLSSTLRAGTPLDYAINKANDDLKLLVTFFPDVAAQQVKDALAAQDVEGVRHGADNSWSITTDKATATKLARLDIVLSVEEGPLPFLELNDQARRVADSDSAHRIDFSNPRPDYRRASGLNVRIGICEGGGFDEDHDDFKTVAADGSVGVSRVYRTITAGGSHGTHVASIAGGNGINSDPNGRPAFNLRGHAPQASLGDYRSFGGNAERFYEAIVKESTDVTNHSYVQARNGGYNSSAASLDRIVRGSAVNSDGKSIPPRPQVWASGNNGSSRQYGNMVGFYAVFTSAKNTISVGSVDTFGARISDFSSLGPTYDGRVKPDVVAPGCNDSIGSSVGILAARNNTQGYTRKCGTSMAAPVVSGIVGLMRHQHMQITSTHRMQPATYKAMLVHSARDAVKLANYPSREFDNPDIEDRLRFHAGPDYVNGYGLVDAQGACDLVAAPNQWRESSMSVTGDEDRFCVYVPGGAADLKVVIAWDDEPGSTITAETVSKLVNDLDLLLIDPKGNSFKPWVLDPLPVEMVPGDTGDDPIAQADLKPARRDEDRRNNVEMVSVCRPMKGIWTIKVKAHDLPNGNPQKYSLVSSSPLRACFPNICEIAPWVCEPPYEMAPIERIDGKLVINPRVPVPVDLICRYVLNCPGCERSLCPGWEMQITQVPAESVVHIVSSSSGVIGRVPVADNGTARIRVKRPVQGDQYFLLFTSRESVESPLEKRFSTKITVEKLNLSEEGIAGLPGISTDNIVGTLPVTDQPFIKLKNRTIKLGKDRVDPKLIETVRAADGNVHGIMVLQSTPKAAERSALKSTGVKLGAYLGNNAYECTYLRTANLDEANNNLKIVRWMGVLEAEDKVERSLWSGKPEKWASADSGKFKVLVAFHDEVADEQAKKLLSEFDDSAKPHDKEGGVWATELSLQDLRKLAQLNEVRSVEPGPDPSNPLGGACCGG